MILATDTSADRRAQWYAVGASFFGWTFDAFDFFILTFMLTDVAKAFGETRPTLTWTLTATLAMRPVGALGYEYIIGFSSSPGLALAGFAPQ